MYVHVNVHAEKKIKNYRFLYSHFIFSVDHAEIKMDKEIYNFLFFPALNTKYTVTNTLT